MGRAPGLCTLAHSALGPFALLALFGPAGGCRTRASAARAAAPGVRVGLLVYEVEHAELRGAVGRGGGDGTSGVEVAPRGRVFAVVTVRRANATQADARATEGGLELLAPDGAAYTPYRVNRLACHGGADDCAVLDPGGARTDALVYSVPDVGAAPARLRVTAARDEPGPRAAQIALTLARE